ncbi:MAG: CHAT domain-containing protein [Caldilineaceae bacterium]
MAVLLIFGRIRLIIPLYSFLSFLLPEWSTHHAMDITTYFKSAFKSFTMTKILYLAANPVGTSLLALDEEMRAIDQALIQSRSREHFTFEKQLAVQYGDLQQLLLHHQPDIVHFSGHGSETGELLFHSNDGKAHPIRKATLGRLFTLLKGNIRCVVLNACYSETQAAAIAEHIDVVIGMKNKLGDDAARHFAAAFYQGLGFGHTVQAAFEMGCLAIDLANLDEADEPQLKALQRDAAATVFLVKEREAYHQVLDGIITDDIPKELLRLSSQVPDINKLWQTLYFNTCPPLLRSHSTATSVATAIQHLWEMPVQSNGMIPILQFANGLAELAGTDPIADRIRKWIEATAQNHYKVASYQIIKQGNAYFTAQSNPVYLQLILRDDHRNIDCPPQDYRFYLQIVWWTDEHKQTIEKSEKSLKIQEIMCKVKNFYDKDIKNYWD